MYEKCKGQRIDKTFSKPPSWEKWLCDRHYFFFNCSSIKFGILTIFKSTVQVLCVFMLGSQSPELFSFCNTGTIFFKKHVPILPSTQLPATMLLIFCLWVWLLSRDLIQDLIQVELYSVCLWMTYFTLHNGLKNHSVCLLFFFQYAF